MQIANELRMCRDRHHDLTERKRRAAEQLNGNTRSREPKQAQILRIQGVIRELKEQKEMKEAEMGKPLQSQLSDEERRQCETLQVRPGAFVDFSTALERSEEEQDRARTRFEAGGGLGVDQASNREPALDESP